MNKRIASFLRLCLLTVLLAGAALPPQYPVGAATALTVEPLTWNVIGLDSNNPNVGPYRFPVGVRACNPGSNTVNMVDIEADFVWLSGGTTNDDSIISLRPGSLDPITPNPKIDLAPGACTDFYFEVEVNRSAASPYNQTRRYRIDVRYDDPDIAGIQTVATTTPRELFVEHLISQNRNAITNVKLNGVGIPAGGTMSLMVGNTYTITLEGGTATQGYNQFEAFINFPNTIFQILAVNTTYSADDSPYVNNPASMLYADACKWENDPNSPNYRACVGGDYKSGGSNVVTTYTIKIIGGGGTTQTLNTLLYDFSGSSYHYNADYSLGTRYASIVDPTNVTITKSFSPNPTNLNGISALTITLTNPNLSAITGYNFTDPLPANMTVANPPSATTTSCGTPTFAPTVGATSLSFSNGTIAANASCTIKVNVTTSTTGSFVNTTNHLFVDALDTGKTATSTLTVNTTPPAPTPPASCTTPVQLAIWTMDPSQGLTVPPLYFAKATDVAAFPTTAASFVSVSGSQTISTVIGNGLNSWGGTAPTAGNGWSETPSSMNNYFQFVLDTSNYGGVYATFDVGLFPNGDWANPTSNMYVNTSANGGAFTVFTPYPQASKGQWTLGLSASAASTGTSTTTFRFGTDGASKSTATLYLDNVRFMGCPRPVPPTIIKSFSPNPIAVGGTSTLTFTLSNPNTDPLSGLSFSDTLPTGLTLATVPTTTCAGPVTGAVGGTAINLTGGNLTGTVAVTNGSATVTGTGTNFLNELAVGRIVVINGVSYTISAIASNTSLTLSTTYTGTTASGLTISGRLAGGGTCTVTATVTASAAGAYQNVSGFVSSTNGGTNTGATGSASASLTVIKPPSMVKIFSPNPILSGGTSTLTFTVTNPNQNDSLTGVTFTDTFPTAPGGMTVAAPLTTSLTGCGAGTLLDNTGGVLAAGDLGIRLTGATITSNSTCTVTVNVAVPSTPASGSYINTSGAISSTNGGTGNTASNTLTVNAPNPSIALYKQVGPTATGPWSKFLGVTLPGSVYYLFTIENTGDVPLSPVSVTDPTLGALGCAWPASLPVAVAANNNHIATCVVGPVSASTGSHPNTATASGTYNSVVYPSTSSSATYASQTLTIAKSVTETSFSAAGDLLHYSYVVTNSGSAPLLGPVTVTDNKATVTCPSVSTAVVGVNPGDGDDYLDPGESITCTATYTVQAADVTAGFVTNIASASISGVTSNTDSKTVNILMPDLTVTKTNNVSGLVAQNGTFNWIVTVTNSGISTASFATTTTILSDTLPSGPTYGVPVLNNGVTPPIGTINCSIAGTTLNCVANGAVTLPVGASFSVTIPVTPTVAGSLVNTATVDPGGVVTESSEANNTSSNTVGVVNAVKTIVSTSESSTGFLTGFERVVIGEVIHYRLTTYLPEGTWTNVQVTDAIDTGIQFLNGSATVSYVCDGVCTNSTFTTTPGTFTSSTDPTFNLGTISNPDNDANAESLVIEFNALVLNMVSNAAGGVTRNNSYSISFNGTTITSAAVGVRVSEPSITDLVKTVSPAAGPYYPGDTITYTLTYSNSSTGVTRATAFDVFTTDTLSANLDLQSVSVTAPTGSTVTNTSTTGLGGVVRVLVNQVLPSVDIAAGPTAVTITVAAQIANAAPSGLLSNTASLTYTSLPGGTTTGDVNGTCPNVTGSCTPGTSGSLTGERNGTGGSPNTYADTSSSDITVTPRADLSLTKTVDNAAPNFGADVTFTLTVANAGPSTATNVSVRDLLPVGLTYVSSTPSQGTYTSVTGIWAVGTINSGANTTLSIVATVSTLGAKTNSTQVIASDQLDPDSTPNDNSTTQDDDDAVTVTPIVPTINAVDDDYTASPVNGSSGGTTASVIDNDTTNSVSAIIGTNVTLTPGTAPTPTTGSITMNADGTISVAAGTTAGTYTYPYAICTLPATTPATCDTANATVVVAAATITANPDTATTAANTPVTTVVTTNDTNLGGTIDPNSVTITAQPTAGTGSVVCTGASCVYTPPAGYVGTTTYTYQVCLAAPNGSACDTAVVTITVTPTINALDDDYTASPINGGNGGTTASVIDNDTTNGVAAVIGTNVTLTPGTAPTPTVGSITMNADGTITVAAGTTAGIYTYPYTICTIPATIPVTCDTANATVVVTAPTITANDDTAATPANTPVTTVVTTNDTNVGGSIDPNSVTVTSQPAAGTGSVVCTGASCVYTPPAGYAGTTSYTYQVCLAAPNGLVCDSATVTVTVAPTINAVDDDYTASPINGGSGGTTTSVIGNDTTNGVAVVIGTNVTLTPGAAPTPTVGSITMNADGTITVAAGTTAGTYTYPYTICTIPATTPATCDNATATVVIAATTINAGDDAETTSASTPVTTVVTTNDTNVGGTIDPNSVTVTAQPAAGTGSVVCTGASCVYTPPAGYIGTTSYTYRVCLAAPNDSVCDTATVTVTVTPTINAVDDDYTASPINAGNGGTTLSVIINDTTNGVAAVIGTNVTLTPGTAPTPVAGSITMNTDGTISVAAGTTAGTYTYPYTICTIPATTPATCDTANATVLVTAPTITANDDTATTPANTSVATVVTANDTNVGGTIDPSSVIVTAQPAAGTGSVVCTGASCVYTPPAGYVGATTYSYQVCLAAPNGSVCDTAVVTVTVTPTINALDDDYTASPIAGGSGGTTASVINNDTTNGVAAVIGTNVTLTPGTAPTPTAGSITMNTNGTITVAAGTTAGTYTYPYTICTDPATTPTTCDVATATVKVNAPVIDAVNDNYSGSPISGAVGGNAGNAFTNDTLNGVAVIPAQINATIITPASNPGVTLNTTTGSVDVAAGTPAGTYTIVYQICENINPANCDTATITVVVSPPASIGGVVFHDVNLDGSKAGSEAGLTGVTVQLYDGTGITLIATATTGPGGTYAFPSLTPGSYLVIETDPSGYVSSTANSVPITIAAGGTGTANFGDYQLPNTALSNISGVVFNDANGNGIQDAGELPLNAVTVELKNNLGVVIGTTTTNALGAYSFTGLPAGTYTVVETDLPGYVSTTLNNVAVNLSAGTNATVHFGDQVNAALIADPAVTKFGSPTNAVVGDTVVYTITVGNNGNANADNVILTDTKPAFLDIVSITISPNPGLVPVITGNTFSISFGTVTPTDFYTVTVLTRVNALGVPPGGANTVQLVTSSVTDRAFNNAFAAGLTISVTNPAPSSAALPATGFAPNVKTDVLPQPQELKYVATDITLEIPSLGISLPVAGVPKKNGMWDVTWLGSQAGWLEGTAFPSWNGNSVLTSHVYLSNGLPGPFVGLNKLKYGDKVIIHAYGQKYTFEVRSNAVVSPNDVSIFKHEEKSWLTLVTCKEYDEKTNTYKKRVAVRAVLVSVDAE